MRRGNQVVTQILIKWKGEGKEDAIWKDYDLMKEKFPSRGRRYSQGRGSVRVYSCRPFTTQLVITNREGGPRRCCWLVRAAHSIRSKRSLCLAESGKKGNVHTDMLIRTAAYCSLQSLMRRESAQGDKEYAENGNG